MALLHSHFSPLHRRANIVPSLRRTSGYTLTSIARSSSLSRRRSSFEASHARADHDREKRLSDQSSWEAKDSEGDDYLFKLGQEAENMNIAVGARKGVIDDLFVGEFLGKDSDIVFDYRQKATRSFEHLKGDYYITPEFMDKVACHIVKNYLSQSLDIKVPLILGIWGGKGQGKTFQTELIFRAMGVEPVIMSAGELESEKAVTTGSADIPVTPQAIKVNSSGPHKQHF